MLTTVHTLQWVSGSALFHYAEYSSYPCCAPDGEEENVKQAQEVMKDVAQRYTEEQRASKNTDNELPELYFIYEGFEVFFFDIKHSLLLTSLH